MDSRKFYNKSVPYILALIVGMIPAMILRAFFIKVLDVGTANLIFIIVFAVCIIVQQEITAFLEDFILPWILKRIPNKKKSIPVNQIEATEDPNEDEKYPWKTEVDNIRLNYENQYLEEKKEKIDLFLKYTHLTMAPYVTNNELLLFDEYIRCYSLKVSLPTKLTPIKPSKLKIPDLYHFGWNMANYFETKKEDVSPWLKEVFFQLLNEDINNITKKLRHSTNKKYYIPIVEDIPKYLREQKS